MQWLYYVQKCIDGNSTTINEYAPYIFALSAKHSIGKKFITKNGIQQLYDVLIDLNGLYVTATIEYLKCPDERLVCSKLYTVKAHSAIPDYIPRSAPKKEPEGETMSKSTFWGKFRKELHEFLWSKD